MGLLRGRRREKRKRRMRLRGGGLVTLCVLLYLAAMAVSRWYAIHRQEIVDVLRWAVPLTVAALCGLLALVVRWRIRSRRKASRVGTELAALTGDRTGKELEEITRTLLERDGWDNPRRVGGSGDMGADNLADGYRGVECPLVLQDKQYEAGKYIGTAEVAEFAGTAGAVHQGRVRLFVTTGAGFTRGAVAVARANNIILIAREDLGAAMAGLRPLVPASVTNSILGGAV